MSKGNKQVDSIKTIVVKILAKEFNRSLAHVYAAADGKVKTEGGENIKKQYDARYEKMKAIITTI